MHWFSDIQVLKLRHLRFCAKGNAHYANDLIGFYIYKWTAAVTRITNRVNNKPIPRMSRVYSVLFNITNNSFIYNECDTKSIVHKLSGIRKANKIRFLTNF